MKVNITAKPMAEYWRGGPDGAMTQHGKAVDISFCAPVGGNPVGTDETWFGGHFMLTREEAAQLLLGLRKVLEELPGSNGPTPLSDVVWATYPSAKGTWDRVHLPTSTLWEFESDGDVGLWLACFASKDQVAYVDNCGGLFTAWSTDTKGDPTEHDTESEAMFAALQAAGWGVK